MVIYMFTYTGGFKLSKQNDAGTAVKKFSQTPILTDDMRF